MSENSFSTVELGRRLGCILYDLLALLAIWWAASLPFYAVDLTVPYSFERLLYQVYLLLIGLFYFVWCWRTRRATLGMRAWNVHIETDNGQPPDWTQATGRALSALVSWGCLGLGFWWCLFHAQKLAWHDLWSHTRLVRTQ